MVCADGPVETLTLEPIAPGFVSNGSSSSPQARFEAERTIQFSIDPDGRPVDLRPLNDGRALSDFRDRASVQEAQAALAVSRFPAEARANCRMVVQRDFLPISEATPAQLVQAFGPSSGQDPGTQAVRSALVGQWGDCSTRRRPRLASYPDPRAGSPTPGQRVWSVTRFDIGPDGATARVETAGSSGDPAFDAETRRAVGETRFFEGGSDTGCFTRFGRHGATLAAPAMPPLPTDPLQDCPSEIEQAFRPGRLNYPTIMQSRGVEGWARVRYDLAPWGQVGNVAVIDAQPSAVFGDAAHAIVAQGRSDGAFKAAIRCVSVVQFRMPTATDAPSNGDTPPPAPF
ncbi:hypothetical protein BZG35_14120 [Brevundimonas sp. LM2]|nr:hypothetical protein BZG35_14120 [Brevundimonas sp. LM2]